MPGLYFDNRYQPRNMSDRANQQLTQLSKIPPRFGEILQGGVSHYMGSDYGGQPTGAQAPAAGVQRQQAQPSILDRVLNNFPPQVYPNSNVGQFSQLPAPQAAADIPAIPAVGNPGALGLRPPGPNIGNPLGALPRRNEGGNLPDPGAGPVADQARQRFRFGPPGMTGHDYGNAVNQAVAMRQLQQFMNAPQQLTNQLNQHFENMSNRNLVLNTQRLQEAGLKMKDRQNRRVIDAIREVLGGSGGGAEAGGPIPPGAIESANAALRNVRPNMGSPYLTNLFGANMAARAPDIERTLTPANRAMGLAMERQRLANLAPLLRMA